MTNSFVVCVTQDPVGMLCPCPARSKVQQPCTLRCKATSLSFSFLMYSTPHSIFLIATLSAFYVCYHFVILFLWFSDVINCWIQRNVRLYDQRGLFNWIYITGNVISQNQRKRIINRAESVSIGKFEWGVSWQMML